MSAIERTQPIFLVSPRYRNEVAAAIEAYGRPVIAARRARDAERRFAQSGARVVVVDARGALAIGLEVGRAVAGAVEANGGAMLMLLSRGDVESLESVYDAGATHFLVSPFGAVELAQAIRFAERSARRYNNGAIARVRAPVVDDGDTAEMGWTFRIADRKLCPSPGMAAALGLPANEPIGLPGAWRLLDHEGRLVAREAVHRLLGSGRATAFAHRLHTAAGERRLAHHLRLDRDSTGRVTGIAASVEDLDAVAVERRKIINFDQLTGLANVAAFRDWVDARLAPPRAFDPAAVLLMVAISRFDAINAAYGRGVGDALLTGIARRLQRLFDDDDGDAACLARLGGAEFALAVPGPVTVGRAVLLAGRIGESFRRPFICEGQVVHLACRIGISVADAEVVDAEALLRRASAALTQAKDNEPNSYQVYLPDAEGESIAEEAALESDLRRAFAEDELEILFQPQIEISSNRLVGVEGLARWRHPRLGLISASRLFGVADRAEISAELGRRILSKALRQAAEWPDALSTLRLSLNVTAADLATERFEDTLVQLIVESGFPMGRLTIEVTEGDLIEDLERASRVLAGLRARGLRVAIDDFGTGYSSLAYLKALPLDYLKLDRALVVDLAGHVRDRVVLQAVIDLARSLGLLVVAEGVENEAQLDHLARAGCNIYQGFLAAPALSSQALLDFSSRPPAVHATAA
jgi:diguanylate cyclase (GGDEF)-like protein